MRDFKSVWRKQIELVIIIPHNDSRRNGYAILFVKGSRSCRIRIRPYPPNLSKMAASTMEPAIGASTCAFGNHKWRPYRGSLIINAIVHASHMRLLDQVESSIGL